MKFYLPENLHKELDDLIYRNPPNFKRGYKRDKLRYILHLISVIRLFNKDYMYEHFVPVNAQILQRRVKNYKEYLSYLITELGIVETDGQYITGKKSTGYRLIDKYQTDLIPVDIVDWSLVKSIKIDKNKKELSVKGLDYLTKWFNPKLKIDFEVVNKFLKEEYNLKKGDYRMWDYNKSKERYKKPFHQYTHAQMSTDKLKRSDFNYKLDNNVYRLHTNLTNMRSITRNALTYDGQKLISSDIKNSQPYISIALLNSLFWIIQKKHPKEKAFFGIEFKREQNLNPQTPTQAIINNIFNIELIKHNNTSPFTMLGKIPESIINKDFTKFINLVVNGKLYEYLRKEFKEQLGMEFENRKQLKPVVFQVLFTSNRYMSEEKRVFKNAFPNVYEVYKFIKEKDKSFLPRLLQSIESYLIINVIAKRIAKEFPYAPIFTIHDSIATTAQYIDDVERIMKEELTKAIGYPPTLAREYWHTDKINNHLNKLKEKAKKLGIHHISTDNNEQVQKDNKNIA